MQGMMNKTRKSYGYWNVMVLLALVLLLFVGCGEADKIPKSLRRRAGRGPWSPVLKKTSMVVEGIVMCQSCSLVGTRSLKDALPISGAKVMLSCKDRHSKNPLYIHAITDSNGYFFIRIASFDFMKHDPLRTCRVFAISSPNNKCNNPLDINSGRFGAFLQSQRTYLDDVIYSVGPFAFAPAYCMKKSIHF